MSTDAYVDLMFAWGHARLGDTETSRRLMASASDRLRPLNDSAHDWLLAAYTWRVEQAISNEPGGGGWPSELRTSFDNLDRYQTQNHPDFKYVVARLRSRSRILEPVDHIDPYRGAMRFARGSVADVFRLITHPEQKAFEESFGKLSRIMDDSGDVIDQTSFLRAALAADDSVVDRLGLIEQSQSLATRLLERDWTDHPSAQTLFARHRQRPTTREDAEQFNRDSAHPGVWVDRCIHNSALDLFRKSLDCAIRIGPQGRVAAHLKDFLRIRDSGAVTDSYLTDILRLLCRGFIHHELRSDATELLGVVQRDESAFKPTDRADLMVVCLALASLDFWLGRIENAQLLLGDVPDRLREMNHPAQCCQVIVQYLETIAHLSWTSTRRQLEMLVGALPRFPNSFTTAAWYSLLHLEVTDWIVLTLVPTAFGPPERVRRTICASEIPSRREALCQAHAKLMAWGRPDWSPTPNST